MACKSKLFPAAANWFSGIPIDSGPAEGLWVLKGPRMFSPPGFVTVEG
jgi:hypothetical protein